MTTKLELFPFEARARTVDHLGREQIADSPTAVSELWKNAYDAYATRVSMHISVAPTPIVAIVDDGHGMRRDEFVDRWLVLGTESKLTAEELPRDRFGLPRRARQGQKGIGRLSVAFLGPLVIVLSKRRGEPFVAATVDWRLFENPFLMLQDVITPVATFETPKEFENIRHQMLEAVGENVLPVKQDNRGKRLKEAWRAYDAHETDRSVTATTSSRIIAGALQMMDTPEILNAWPAWIGTADHGTALLVYEPKPELLVWVDGSVTGNTDESRTIQENFVSTLTGFVDPLSGERVQFDYEVVAHRSHGPLVVLSARDEFGRPEFDRLEHALEGKFDRSGAFLGTVRVFGQELRDVTFPPPPDFGARSRVGSFEFAIGTFEQEEGFSTHTAEEHAMLKEATKQHAGLRVYRDGLRVMPYGRPDNDFFELEARRSLHAGREFWQHRRVFGRVALASAENPHLRDKAGREGLIDNSSRRELKQLVVHLLKAAARKYFGTDAPSREEDLARVHAAKRAAKEARETVSRAINKRVVHHIRERGVDLEEALEAVAAIRRSIERATAFEDLEAADEQLGNLQRLSRELRLPPRAGRLTAANEDRYLDFRRRHRDLVAEVTELKRDVADRLEAGDPGNTARKAEIYLAHRKKDLTSVLNSYERTIKRDLPRELARIVTRIAEDRQRVVQSASSLTARLGAVGARVIIDETFDDLSDHIFPYYEHYISLLERFREGVDLFIALTGTISETAELEARAADLNALAQMGITVEIVGHELDRLDQEVRRQLARMSPSTNGTAAFERANVAYDALVNRLKFLSPLRVAGTRLRERVSGNDIADYICDFYAERFRVDDVVFTASEAFRRVALLDYRFRLYPVFINLINNALYWLQFARERKIAIDLDRDDIVVADSGPGVDPEDVGNLFGLFFTRRMGGRGIGLYLAKANLGASGHHISYRTGGPLLKGANFIITPREILRGNSGGGS